MCCWSSCSTNFFLQNAVWRTPPDEPLIGAIRFFVLLIVCPRFWSSLFSDHSLHLLLFLTYSLLIVLTELNLPWPKPNQICLLPAPTVPLRKTSAIAIGDYLVGSALEVCLHWSPDPSTGVQGWILVGTLDSTPYAKTKATQSIHHCNIMCDYYVTSYYLTSLHPLHKTSINITWPPSQITYLL